MWQVPSYNEHSSSSRLSYLEAPTPPDRVDISGDLTDFSSTNGGVLAVKGTKKLDESHVDLTRHCGKSPVTMNTVLQRIYKTLHCRRAGFEPQRIVVQEEGESPPSTRRSRPSQNDDPHFVLLLLLVALASSIGGDRLF